MVANEISHGCVLAVTFHVEQVEEAFIAFSRFRQLVFGHETLQLGSNSYGVDHFTLGIAGMNAGAFDMNFGSGCVEAFKLQLAHIATIDGVSPFTAKFLNVEQMSTKTDFFVGIEAYANVAVLNLGMLHQVDHSLNDGCNAGLVVSTEQSVSIGNDEVFALMAEQLGEYRRT